MQTRILGKTGYTVSEMGLGCWQLGDDFGPVKDSVATDILATAKQHNISLLDTADVYGGGLSEKRIGAWLKQLPLSERPFVITKVGRDAALYPDGYTKENVRKNIVGSIERLGVEALDLVQTHCVPPEVLTSGELFGWLIDFKKEGLIKHFGASVEMLDEALFCCDVEELATLQIIFNVFRQDAIKQLLPKAEANNIGIIVRLPLASGLLSGAMRLDRVFDENDHRNYNRDGQYFHVGETFNGIPYATGVALANAAKPLFPAGLSLAQASLRWLLDQPQVSTIIAGASKVEQVVSNAGASDLAPLTKTTHDVLAEFYTQQVRPHIRGGI